MQDRRTDAESATLPERYRVIRAIGSGGTATVYLAEDTASDGRSVAVKVLNPSLVGAVAVDRFLREIKLIRTLRHPAIVPLLDAGDAQGVPFFVMPFIEGESLRKRLVRERQLPLDDVVQIVRTLANALEAAHAMGVVHRDVKPENVLVRDGDVLLADFGIARALSQAVGERLTDSGLAIGTPGYMSPEQATGEREIDIRTDIYSLGCLAFEMLTGETPYTGATAQAVVAKQLTLPVPSMLVVRETLPQQVDDVVRQALAKTPADRFRSAAAFADALAVAARSPVSTRRSLGMRLRRHALPLAGGGVAVLAVVAMAVNRVREQGAAASALVAADTLRYAVLPFQGIGGDGSVDSAVVSTVERGVRDALRGWTDVTIVDAEQVREAAASAFVATPTRASARAVALAVRAGRYVRGEVRAAAGSSELRVRLLDAFRGDSVLAEAVAVVPREPGALGATMATLVDSLVLRDALHVGGGGGGSASRSLPARQAFGRGQRALDRWDLLQADSAFMTATQQDERYAAAHLWLALSRLWQGAEPSRWRIAAERAVATGDRLPMRERAMATAVLAEARDDRATACGQWRALTRADSLDAMAWYGTARCLAADDRVLADARSPSGFRFRSSYHEALQAYERAFRAHPPMLAALGGDAYDGDAFDALIRLFKTGTTQLRRGRAEPPSSRQFTSGMEWSRDSIVFVPSPWGESGARYDFRSRQAMNEAVRHQRVTVRSIASAWVAAYPKSADAWHALAQALASRGEVSALDTLVRAKSLATALPEKRRILASEVAMQLAFGLRAGDTLRVLRAKQLADSLLAHADSGGTQASVLLASLSVLTGRPTRAMPYLSSRAVLRVMSVPDLLPPETASYLVLCALGGPADSLKVWESRIADGIARRVPKPEQQGRRLEFLARGASMAYPDYTSDRATALATDGDPLVAWQVRLQSGDTAFARDGLRALRKDRALALPELLSLDALAPEARLLLRVNETRSALDWLAPTLDALPMLQPTLLSSPIRAASLVPVSSGSSTSGFSGG